MSRSGYTDDGDNVAMWRGQVASATRGKRGQRFFRDLVAALDAMPEKRLIRDALEADGEVCAIELNTLRRDVEIMRDALEHAQNALLDYIPTLEKRGASLHYGRKVLNLISVALKRSAPTVTTSASAEDTNGTR